jgi:RNA polymerase sigma-70 factor (ECF subfamily)
MPTMFGQTTLTPKPSPAGRQFVTTNWSMVVRAGKQQTPEQLAEICRIYWYPLYASIRQRGVGAHDAEDLIQGFFAWLLTNNVVERADKNRGRFRVFLQVALKQYCAREHRRASARKRRPPRPLLSLDLAEAETRWAASTCHVTPDRIFDQSWAVMVLSWSMDRLRDEYEQSGRGDRFRLLSPFMTDEKNASREEVRQQLNISESAFAMALSRLRQQFGKILMEEIARTVDDPADIEDEMNHIWSSLAKP